MIQHQVYEYARIRDNVKITGNAHVYGEATVREYAIVCGYSRIYGHAIVMGNACISGQTEIGGNTKIMENVAATESELNNEQLLRNDETYDSVFEMCRVMTENKELEFDISYVGVIADYAATTLAQAGHKVRFPSVITDGDRQYIEEYYSV